MRTLHHLLCARDDCIVTGSSDNVIRVWRGDIKTFLESLAHSRYAFPECADSHQTQPDLSLNLTSTFLLSIFFSTAN